MGWAGQSGCRLQERSHGEHLPDGHEESGGHQANTSAGPVIPGLWVPSHQWPERHLGSHPHALQTVSLRRRQERMHAASTIHPGRIHTAYNESPVSFVLCVALICTRLSLVLPYQCCLWYCSAAICSPHHLFISIANIVVESERRQEPMQCFVKWITFSDTRQHKLIST